jgi:hypothetical protein
MGEGERCYLNKGERYYPPRAREFTFFPSPMIMGEGDRRSDEGLFNQFDVHSLSLKSSDLINNFLVNNNQVK